MSGTIVFQQMLVILILVAIGYGVYKKGWITDAGSRSMSFLVVNITNPALNISSAFRDDLQVTHKDILSALLLYLILYLILTAFGHLLANVLADKKENRRYYIMQVMYTNVGFIGIPLASAVLGSEAVVYVAIYNIIYNIFFYTHGYTVMFSGIENINYKVSWKTFINVGTISSILCVFIFWYRLRFPAVIEDVITAGGKATTFMAMIVLGVSLAKIPLKKLVGNYRIFILWGARFLIFPIVAGIVLTRCMDMSLMTSTLILLLAMPVGNMPLMIATQYELDTDILSSGIFISTVLSIVTVTLTSLTMA